MVYGHIVLGLSVVDVFDEHDDVLMEVLVCVVLLITWFKNIFLNIY